MSIVFSNPFLLLALAAGAVPILIHRLTHQKTVKRPFSAVRLLAHSQRIVARPQRIKHFLLLALRVAAVSLPVLAAAQPALVRPGLLALAPGGAKAIIVDNSMSMGYEDDGTVRFNQALKAARAIIDHSSDQVAVIPTVARPGEASPAGQSLLKPSKEAADALSRLSLSFRRGDPGAALARAFTALRPTKGQQDVVVISDMAKGDWQAFDPARLGIVPANGHISFLRIGGAGRDGNATVRSVTTGAESIFAGSPFPLEVLVSNFSDKDRKVVVSVLLEGKKADQRSVALKGGEEERVVFEFVSPKSGWKNGEVQLSPDGLDADNSYYFSFFVREKGKIVIVDGDPRVAMRENESYYLTKALLPDDSEGSPFQVEVVHEQDLSEKDLSGYDVIFLLNLRQPPAAKLAGLLQAGKSVLVFLGDKVLPEEYNSMTLFPWRLRGLRDFGGKPERISRIDFGSDVLTQFRDSGAAALSAAQFLRSYRVEGATKSLLTLGNGDPLLLLSPWGKGKLYLFASSADLDWNDLPLSAAYVPLIQSLVKRALRDARTPFSQSPVPTGVRFGEAFEGKVPSVQVSGVPAGPGVYLVSTMTGEDVRLPVNVDPAESDLAKMAGPDLARLLPGVAVDVKEYQASGENGVWGSRRDLWPYLLGLLLLVLAVEMGVANRT